MFLVAARNHTSFLDGTPEPSGPTFFAWLGDESNSMMSYIDLNWNFSQFDRDNSARQHGAGYAKIANILAASYSGDPVGKKAAADDQLTMAQLAFATHDYLAALGFARTAYGLVAEEGRSRANRRRSSSRAPGRSWGP